MGGRLLVVRDRAHAREVESDLPRGSAVWTLRELFERLAAWALLDPRGAGEPVRDDDAPLFACANALAERGIFPARLAADARALRAALLHGRTSAAEVVEVLARPGRAVGPELSWLLGRLAAADRLLADAALVDGVSALARAVDRLGRGELPSSVAGFDCVVVRGLVDPTELELRALIGLARAGAALQVVLPMDSAGRGLLAGVEPVLATFEAAHDAPALEILLEDMAEPATTGAPLGPFVRAWYAADGATVDSEVPVEVALVPDEAAEADDVARVVAAWKQAQPDATVAVALRSVGDESTTARFADALVRHGMVARVRRRPLADSAVARLVLDWLALRLHGAPRDRLLAVLANPARRGALPVEEAARVQRTLRLAAARTDMEDASRPSGGYHHRLERFAGGTDDRAQRDAAQAALAAISPILERAAALPLEAPLLVHLERICQLVDEVSDAGAHLACAEVRAELVRARDAARRVARPSDAPVALSAAARIIEGVLRAAQASDVEADDRAPEILSLPELWGRRFDHVVVAGCVEGRLPRAERAERLLSDQERAAINGALGRTALRLFDDDPLQASPVPRTQALEPVWMLGALRAAASSLLLTAARRDARGREAAPSVFLLEALRALGAAPDQLHAGRTFARAPSSRDREVRAARLRADGRLDDARAAAAGVDATLLERVDRACQMRDQRARFFFAQGVQPELELKAPFAFAVEPARMARAFGSSFGLTAERPLTPTRLEALATCRWYGFVQHVLKVDVDAPAGNDADARVIGTLAHAVMERFYAERRRAHAPATRMTRDDRRRVRELVAEEASPWLAGRATGHLGAIRAQIAWLETALVRAVSMLARTPPVNAVEPVAFEVQFGTSSREHAADYGAVPLQLGERSIWVGGVIDRVDEGNGGRAVIDYKFSGSNAVANKVKGDTLFTTHFQLLLYLRLLEHHRPTAAQAPLHGYLVALKDGTTSKDIGDVPELRARLTDDARDDGLAAGIGRVLLPILGGVLSPDPNERCATCRLRRVCRLPLAAEGAPDDDDERDGDAS